MKLNNMTVTNRTNVFQLSKLFYTVFLIVIIFINPCLSQSSIYLQHREKPNRQKKISLKNEYKFTTGDTTLYRHHITSFSGDTLLLSSKYSEEIVKININDINFLKKEKKYGAFEVIAYLGMISLSITPVIWATEGNEAALGMLEVSGVLFACSVPFIVVKDIGRKKNTKTKWKICTG